MADQELRKRVAVEAAKLMYEGVEKEYYTAKRKVARRLGLREGHRSGDLPSNREIRERILELARIYEGDGRTARLGAMRHYALALMRCLRRFHPKLIGSVCTGHVRQQSDIDIHAFSDTVSAVTLALGDEGLAFEVEHKRVMKHGEERQFTHIHAHGEHEVEITVYPEAKKDYPFKSSITGERMEALTIAQLEATLRREHPELDPDQDPGPERGTGAGRRSHLRALLVALEGVQGGPHHPEGDQLYHSLQVFDLARHEHPFDAELAEAALLHDVGKAIDPSDHAAAGAEVLEGLVSERVRFLVAHHMDALALQRCRLPARRACALRASPFFEDLMVLRSLDSRGRQPGVAVTDLERALDFIEDMDLLEAGYDVDFDASDA